jgi:hypothetical protein
MTYQILLLLVPAIVTVAFKCWEFEMKRERRRDYYRNSGTVLLYSESTQVKTRKGVSKF